ncbi:MAG TPA: DUF805 domain-containing protein [Longimicrobiaceae bacterium]|nr:DUF805 domain-containing protein [Longimicrobiaceae bacterium]
MEWYLEVFRKYAVFSGRARRKEYWMFVLFNVLASISLAIADGVLGLGGGFGLLGAVYALAVLVPGLAVSVRRLHDTGRSGWWLLVAIVPILGPIALLVLMALDGEPGPNQYGANPKEGVLYPGGGMALT